MNLSPRNKLLVLIGIVLLVAVAMIAGLVVPAVQQISVVRQKIDQATSDADSAKVLLEQRRQIRDRAASTDLQALQLAVAVPENPDLPTLVIDLQDLASGSGVFLSSIQPGALVITEGVPHVGMPVTLVVQGPWVDVVDYLQQLQRLPRQLRVTDVNVGILPEPSEQDAAEPGITVPPYYQVEANIQLTAYIIPAGSVSATSAPAPEPAPAPAPTQ